MGVDVRKNAASTMATTDAPSSGSHTTTVNANTTTTPPRLVVGGGGSVTFATLASRGDRFRSYLTSTLQNVQLSVTQGTCFTKYRSVLIGIALMVFVYQLWIPSTQTSELDPDAWHSLLRSPVPSERCFDADDPAHWKIEDAMLDASSAATTAANEDEAMLRKTIVKKTCTCADPLVPLPRLDAPAWRLHHEAMAQQAQTAPQLLDFVLYGDSITEHWTGTRMYGQQIRKDAEEMTAIWKRYFNVMEGEGTLHGLPLGTAGDVSPNLLYHLQNGWLPDTLNPRAFVILIGTNDIGSPRSLCSKRNALAGILHVADYLSRQRPGTPIVLHGLLPRVGGGPLPPGAAPQLGRYWEQIIWINRELKRFAGLHPHWHYIDAAFIFLQRPSLKGPLEVGAEEDTQGQMELKWPLMTDGLHPSVKGYEAWAPYIASQLERILDPPPPSHGK
jgi:lysophospholipase L1-like esterase